MLVLDRTARQSFSDKDSLRQNSDRDSHNVTADMIRLQSTNQNMTRNDREYSGRRKIS